MRLTQLQKIQKITNQNRRQQFKRTWKTTLVLLGSSVGLGTVLWTLPAAAATTAPATTPQSATSSVTTSAATSTGSVALSATSTATSSAASVAPTVTNTATSTVTSTAASASVTTSTASATISSASSAASTSMSAASAATSTTASTSGTMSAATSAGVGLTLPTLPSSVATSLAMSSSASTASTASQTSSTASQATTSVANSVASVALPDATVVAFDDPGIEVDVLHDLNVVGPITLGEIRNYTGTSLNIGTTNVPLEITGTLAGMQYLQYLPAKTLINFYTSYSDANVDLTPLENDRFDQLSIMDHDLGSVNLAPLTKIDPTTISTVQLVGSTKTDMSDYQQNAFGMNDAQLAQLGPWLTAIDNTSIEPLHGQSLDFNFSQNSLTNFSPLAGFTQGALFTALGQRVNYGATPVNMVIGQPAVFTALPLIGMTGESLTSHYQTTLSGSPTVSQATADTTHPAETLLTSLGNGKFEIPTAYPTITGATWFAYGLQGYYQLTEASQLDTNFIHVDYPNGTTFEYDVMVYQPANWLTAPELNVNYVDATTKQAIQPAQLLRGTTIGANYDLTPQTQITGYEFEPQESSSPTGTYTQDPQALTFAFVRQRAGGITVNYVTTSGTPIAASQTINGNVGDPYQTQPQTIAGYTCEQVAATGLPASGTLPSAAGTVTYVYTANTLVRTIRYVDVTTGKTLSESQITSPYMSPTSYDAAVSIADYEGQGYQLVSDNYPTTGLFTDPTANMTYVIDLAHRMETLTPTSPDLPTDIDLATSTSRTINYYSTDGTQLAAPTVQTLHFTRDAVLDQVTGDVTYGPWIADDDDAFSPVTVPIVRSYQPDVDSVPAVTAVASGTPDQVVTVTYGATTPATSGATSSSSQPAQSATSNASMTASGATSSAPTAFVPTSAVPVTATTSAPTPVVTSKPVATVTPIATAAKTVRGVQPISTGVTTTKVPKTSTVKTVASVQPVAAQATTKPTSVKPTKTARQLPSHSVFGGLPQTGERTSVASLLGLLLLALVAGATRIKQWFKRVF